MVNRLAQETSPYLLQHAHNPVDWYPWGREALDRARVEDRPILLSIGYSACHWCHVMERESFENPQTAALMNASFVNIKVDREERPDLDGIYMQAVQAMTGSGGWPMTVFLTPDGTPFYGGTYYPPADRGSTPGFPRVLTSIAHAWQNRRAEIQESGTQLRQHLQQSLQPGSAGGDLTADILDDASRALIAQHDPEFGGLGGTPKFPQPMGLEFLLRTWRRTGSESALNVVLHTLDQMARGGIYDHLGGGFARYSTDAEWLVPHFEKMLYDNAQLARIYLLAYQATGRPALRLVVEETLGYILGDMTDPGGGIYSTEDADSEGEEGKFYVWRPAEVSQLLGDSEARIFGAYYDIQAPGNFEGKASILHVDEPAPAVAARLGIDALELAAVIDRGRQVLFAARARRVRPARDEKVLAAWNGLLLRTLAEAGRVLDRADYTGAAVRNADFLLREMRQPDGGLYRTWKPGHAARLNGYLEDYANVADGLTALYEATFDQRWLAAATELAQVMLDRFADTERGGFFDTSTTHETLITRPKDLFDNATPSGNAVAADVLLRLAVLTDNAAFRAAAEGTLRVVREPMSRYPLGFGRYLCALDFLLAEPKEVAIVGEAPEALLRVVFEPYLPNKVVAGGAARIPLLADRPQVAGRATAYVCEHYACQAPTTDPEVLRALLHG